MFFWYTSQRDTRVATKRYLYTFHIVRKRVEKFTEIYNRHIKTPWKFYSRHKKISDFFIIARLALHVSVLFQLALDIVCIVPTLAASHARHFARQNLWYWHYLFVLIDATLANRRTYGSYNAHVRPSRQCLDTI